MIRLLSIFAVMAVRIDVPRLENDEQSAVVFRQTVFILRVF